MLLKFTEGDASVIIEASRLRVLGDMNDSKGEPVAAKVHVVMVSKQSVPDRTGRQYLSNACVQVTYVLGFPKVPRRDLFTYFQKSNWLCSLWVITVQGWNTLKQVSSSCPLACSCLNPEVTASIFDVSSMQAPRRQLYLPAPHAPGKCFENLPPWDS